MTSSVSILDEELRSKIEENARLHKQVKTQLRKLQPFERWFLGGQKPS